jgi:hypothetical protein
MRVVVDPIFYVKIFGQDLQDPQDIFFQAFQMKAWKHQSPSAINKTISNER